MSARSRATAEAVDTFSQMADAPTLLEGVLAETVAMQRRAAAERACRVARIAITRASRFRHEPVPGAIAKELLRALESVRLATEALLGMEDETEAEGE